MMVMGGVFRSSEEVSNCTKIASSPSLLGTSYKSAIKLREPSNY